MLGEVGREGDVEVQIQGGYWRKSEQTDSEAGAEGGELGGEKRRTGEDRRF